MKTIIDARLILPQQTGIGRYLLGLAQGFNNIPGSDEFEFWVQDKLPTDHQIWLINNSRIKFLRLPVAHMSVHQQWAIPYKISRTAHDILHYPHFDLPFATPGKIVVTIYDLKYLIHPNFFPQLAKTKRLIMHLMMSYAVHRAQRVITISNNTRSDLATRLKISVDKIRVTYLGVDRQYFSDPDTTLIETFRRNLSLQDPFILYVGERRPHKNITGVIRAFNLFNTMVPKPYKLVIAGKPYADYHEPEHLVERLELGDKVLFLDAPPDSDVRLLYQSAEAFVLLSRYEGFGLPVLEAMASKTPVVASNAASLPEVVGDAGVIVPVDDSNIAAEALRHIIKGGDKRDMLISRGFERARQFTWENCAQMTLNIYREVNLS